MCLTHMESQTVPLQRLSYSIAEAEIVSNLSRSTLYREVSRGHLRLVKVGKRSLIPADALERLCGMADNNHSPEAPSDMPSITDIAQAAAAELARRKR